MRKWIDIIFNNSRYNFCFSIIYAWYLGTFFYPGLLYSDSVARWRTAIDFANGGFAALAQHSDHHPVLPTMLMGFFYKLTGEIGAFTLFQIFLFAFFSFNFVAFFAPKKYANIFVSLILLTPIFKIYSIFISYDTLFSVFLVALLSCFLKESTKNFIFVPFIFAFLVGTRLNSILLMPLVIFFIFYAYKSYSVGYKLLCSFGVVGLCFFIILIPGVLNMNKGSSFLIGTAWEYANLAIKTEDDKYISYLRNKGADVEKIKEKICYRGIWCGNEHSEFVSKIKPEDGRDLLSCYVNLAFDYPLIFAKEKIKYTKSLMGVGSNLLFNAEIARWREKRWKAPMEGLGFYSNARREIFIDKYFSSSSDKFKFLFKPWVVIVLILFLALINFLIYKKNFIIILFFPIIYYSTFILTSQNHEMRYFFPVVMFFMLTVAILLANISDSIEKFLLRNLCINRFQGR